MRPAASELRGLGGLLHDSTDAGHGAVQAGLCAGGVLAEAAQVEGLAVEGEAANPKGVEGGVGDQLLDVLEEEVAPLVVAVHVEHRSVGGEDGGLRLVADAGQDEAAFVAQDEGLEVLSLAEVLELMEDSLVSGFAASSASVVKVVHDVVLGGR